jgi:hypothetical protein
MPRARFEPAVSASERPQTHDLVRAATGMGNSNTLIFPSRRKYKWAAIAQSVQRLATRWTVLGSNPGGGEIFRTRPGCSSGHPASFTLGTRSLSRRGGGTKRPGRGADIHPNLASKLKNEQSYTSTPTLRLHGGL